MLHNECYPSILKQFKVECIQSKHERVHNELRVSKDSRHVFGICEQPRIDKVVEEKNVNAGREQFFSKLHFAFFHEFLALCDHEHELNKHDDTVGHTL